MKALIALLSVLIVVSCQHNDGKATYSTGTTTNINGYTITTDTVTINGEENILPLLRYNGNYYYSAFARDSLGDYELTHFCSIDNQGNIDFFKGGISGIEMGYDDVHIRHDSIVIKSYYDNNVSFYLDDKIKKCVPIKAVDDVVFEDADYYVTSIDFGEWGSATWFKDKRTGLEYEVAGILPPEVIKFKGAYYLVSPSEINVVKNPKLLVKTGIGTYEKFKGINKVGDFYSREPKAYTNGLENIYSRERTYEIERDFFIGPAFVHNDSLRFIVNENNTMYVAKAESKKLISVARIGDGVHSIRENNSYRNLYLNKMISFTKMKKDFGLLEIKDNSIQLHYFKNKPKNK